MKIAIALSGHMRGYERAWPTIQKNVIGQLNHMSQPNIFDIFISTWGDIGWYTGKHYLKPSNGFVNTDKSHKGFVSGNPVNVVEIQKFYNPVHLNVEDFDIIEPMIAKKAEPFTNALTNPKNTVSQLYKLNSVLNDVQQYSNIHNIQYDLVIRTRPDFLLQDTFPNLQMFSQNIIYTNLAKNSKGFGVGDQFMISGFDNMMRFKGIYNNLDELYTEVGYSCPHIFTEVWMKKLKIPYYEIPNEIMKATIAHSPHQPYTEHDTGKVWEPQQ